MPLVEEGYETPTPIQSQTIPHVLAGRDVVGIAQTGTGKTAAFALPILHHLSKNRMRPERKSCRVLVLSPTRELSGQIVDSFKTYGRHHEGLGDARHRRRSDRPADAGDGERRRCAGRHARPPARSDAGTAVSLDKVEIFVLDEADRMLDMGFIHDIRRIVGKLPTERQTLFFSATMPPPIEELGRMMLRDPARVAVTPQASTAERISQRVVHVDEVRQGRSARRPPAQRADRPRHRLHPHQARRRQAWCASSTRQGLAAEAIHGNKSQGQRERALAAFRNGKVKTLIATDIAARGIDVDGITHVINYDLPNVPESYVHRIGRTARAGAEGIAISFCDHEERAYLRDIERLIRMSLPSTDKHGRTGRRIARPRRAGTRRPASAEGKPRNRPGQRGVGATRSREAPARPEVRHRNRVRRHSPESQWRNRRRCDILCRIHAGPASRTPRLAAERAYAALIHSLKGLVDVERRNARIRRHRH